MLTARAKWIVDILHAGGRDLGPHLGTMVENCGRSNKFISVCVCERAKRRARKEANSLKLTFYQVGELRVCCALCMGLCHGIAARPLAGRRLSPNTLSA